MLHLVLLLLMQLFQRQTSLLVLAALVLEPDANNPRTETSHLDELFLHQCVWTRVGRVAGAQRVKLFLVQHRSYARRLGLAAAVPRPCPATGPTATGAVRAGCAAVVDGGTSRMTGTSVRTRRRRAVEQRWTGCLTSTG